MFLNVTSRCSLGILYVILKSTALLNEKRNVAGSPKRQAFQPVASRCADNKIFDNYIPDTLYTCRHFAPSDHLDGIGPCLVAKGEICLCDKFLDQSSKLITTKSQSGKSPKKEASNEDFK